MVRANAVESRSHSRLRDHLTRIGKKPIDLLDTPARGAGAPAAGARGGRGGAGGAAVNPATATEIRTMLQNAASKK